MQLEVSELESGIKQVSLSGRMDMNGTAAIEDSFTFSTSSEQAAVLVDMSGVEFIASIGMRLLVKNAKALENREGKMVLFNPVPLVKDALGAAGIGQLIPIYDDLEAARAALDAALS